MIAGVGDSLLSDLGRIDLLPLMIGERPRHHPIGLMAVLRGKFAVPVQYFCRRLQLLRVAGSMSGDLGRSRSLAPNLRQMLFDLATARARRFKILLGVALDLRLAMLAALDLVAEVL